MNLFPTFFSSKTTVANFLLITVFAVTGQIALSAQNTINISTEKMNTLFVGVTNHVNITVDGIPDEQVYLASDEVEIEKMGKGVFNVRAANPGRVTLTVHGDGAFQYKNYQFDVQELPDPMVVLHLDGGENKYDGEVTAAHLKKAEALGFQLPGNAIEIVSFNLVRVPKMGDPVSVPNDGAELSKKAKSLVDSAASGDRFYFDNVMGKVAGEKDQRKLNSLVFNVK